MDTRVGDGYPTRIHGKPNLLDRTDPPVWGTEADGPFDAATLAGHDARGYSVVEGLLSPAEVQAYWQELVRLSSDEGLKKTGRVIVEKKAGPVAHIFDTHVLTA